MPFFMRSHRCHSELSFSGVAWLLLSASLWALGLARADGLLTSLMSLALLLLPFARWQGRRSLRALSVEWQMPTRAMVGRALPLRAILHLRRAIRIRNLHLIVHLPNNPPHRISLPQFIGARSITHDEHVVPQGRGSQELLRFDITSDFPWGWWQHRIAMEQTHSLCICPQVLVPPITIESGQWHDDISDFHQSHDRADGEWRGLREWRAGDALKHLHLAASARSLARGQGLMVAEHDRPGNAPSQVVVMFHSFATDRTIIRPESFERGLSLLAGTLRHLVNQQVPACLVADFDGWCEQPCTQPSELQHLFERFARVQRAAQTEWHDWQQAQKSIDPQAQLWIISDMPTQAWQRGILPRRSPVRLIDTTKKARAFSTKGGRS